MVKKLISILCLTLTINAAVAQNFDGNGYFRVQNAHTNRYAYLLDNWVKVDKSATKVTLSAIELWKDLERAQSDPATVLYFNKVDNNKYDILAQGASLHSLSGTYLSVRYLADKDAYLAYGTYSGMTKYLTDDGLSVNAQQSWMCDTRYGDWSNWRFIPITSTSDNFFGIKPTVEVGGKHYASMYCSFPFEASYGMKVNYVYKIDTKRGLAIYKSTDANMAPASMPMFIECKSASVADNKVYVGNGANTSVSGNLLVGVYFNINNYYHPHVNQVKYEPATMRLLGVTADGSLGFVTSSEQYVPRNTAYLPVPAGSPADFKLVTEDEYQYILDHEVIEAASVTLSQTSASIVLGQIFKLNATVLPDNTTDKTVTWTSSAPAIASVAPDGTVTGLAIGNATITARCGNATASCQVAVGPVMPTQITLQVAQADIKIGETFQLIPTITPANTTDKTVTWVSSATNVATVDANGLVTGHNIGTTEIRAYCGNVLALCQINVHEVPAQSITLSSSSLAMPIGSNHLLEATVLPANTTYPTVSWSSSAPDVVRVNESGMLEAIAIGSATITAACGSASAQCDVVVEHIEAQSITLSHTSLALTLGQTAALQAAVYPADASRPLVWESSDPAVASVSDAGIVTALSVGVATIKASCGQAYATCQVSVALPPAEGITLSMVSAELLIGEDLALTATIYPENADPSALAWSSSHPEVASVDADGHVIALAEGQATITVSAGQAEASCEVTVLKHQQSILWEQDFSSVYDGMEIELTATSTSGLDVYYTITVGDESVAAIDGNKLSLIMPATIVVRASQDGDDKYLPAPSVEKGIQILAGIESVGFDSISVSTAGGVLRIQGLPEGTPIAVYDLSGRLIYAGPYRQISIPSHAILRVGAISIRL